MQEDAHTQAALAAFDELGHELSIFMDSVAKWFTTHPRLSKGTLPAVHSIKSRVKDRAHLAQKINRKSDANNRIDGQNVGLKITDLTGVRVLHLHQEQAALIHREIMEKCRRGDWHLFEEPKAYTWDPEAQKFFEDMGLQVHIRESAYTSVHYVIRPKPESQISCEIQVRTLFEEIWGEVDHTLNYPTPASSVACREQLLVLAKVVGAGSRLVTSIFRTIIPEGPVVPPSSTDSVIISVASTSLKEAVATEPQAVAIVAPEPQAETSQGFSEGAS